ncbi:hypothetical protein [Streptomyces iconiensis]|uniref:Helix-turn-helix domain-containing protein n=1 Tax=Streptomyces iconiensis TaxID=1384038 RepID=A0ABT6ZQ85_9ACTN|nr:hypothetical protein [Streptomyces iconiensis]MDJ1131220.1 hypothetical protein [Streptomyces iconiensis]
MADDEGGPDMVSFRELARRLGLSHQRVSQLHREDPDFPPVVKIGRSNAVDYRVARPYFEAREPQQGRRTDLEQKREEAPPEEE